MKKKLYLIGWDNSVKKVSQKEMVALLGKNFIDTCLKEAEYSFARDPMESIEYMTPYGRLHIEINL